MNKSELDSLIGKTKEQIKNEIGQEFNFYPNNIWTYVLKTNWFGRKKILKLHFIDDAVCNIQIVMSFEI